MATVQADLIRGDWTDPRLSLITVDEWAERWLHTKSPLKPKTLTGYRSNLKAHVLPDFGRYQPRHIDRMAVEEWITDLQATGLGPSGIRQARQVLNSMLTLAVDACYLATNPADAVRTPRQPEPQMLFLDADQVDRLADAIQEPTAASSTCSHTEDLRWEKPPPSAADDSTSNGPASWLPSRCQKPAANSTTAPPRTIEAAQPAPPIPPRPPQQAHGSTRARRTRRSGVHLTPRCATSQQQLRRQVWYTAVDQAGLPQGLRIHDLRHTCASLLIAAGANPKAVPVHLGHSSISVTMDRYTHLFPADVEALIGRLEDIRTRSLAAQPRPNDRSRGIELGGR